VTRALDVRDAVDPKHDLALINDVQGADTGEADRKRPQRTIRNDPFSAQADAPEQLREQVARLTIRVGAERRIFKRRMIGKLSRRSEQIGWQRWTIGKVFRWSGHSCHPFLRLRSMISKWSGQSYGLGVTLGRCANHVRWRCDCAVGSSPDIVQVEARSLAPTDHNRPGGRP
jgi:hypothetical protein